MSVKIVCLYPFSFIHFILFSKIIQNFYIYTYTLTHKYTHMHAYVSYVCIQYIHMRMHMYIYTKSYKFILQY